MCAEQNLNALMAALGLPTTPATSSAQAVANAVMGASPHPSATNALTAMMASAPPTTLLGGWPASEIYENPLLFKPPTTLLGAWPAEPISIGSLFHQPVPPPVWMWAFVRRRFAALLADLEITDRQREDGMTKANGIRACLNRQYRSLSLIIDDGFTMGSWGKETQCRPSADVDILFLLPAEVYFRFEQRSGNKQSQLLQEVKDVLGETYSQTTMRADGQVVQIPFNTIMVEISPGFRCSNGSIIVPDTNGGGRYMTSTAAAEADEIAASDQRWNGNTRALVKMMKRWRRESGAPLKSFHIERLVIEFLDRWQFSRCDAFFHDWMVRDFFAHLISRANGSLAMPGTSEVIRLGSDWLYRAQVAHRHAVTACEYEKDNYQALAGDEWRAIFGSSVSVIVP